MENRISRRQLLQTLGIAAMTAPMEGFGQGRCFGDRKGTPECNTTPFPAPFAPTGWKTVALDHFSVQVEDLEKEAAFFNALMSWKVRSNDGTKIVMDIGNVGSLILRGGYKAPAGAATGRGAPRRVVWDGFCWGISPWDTKKVEAELTKR